MFHFVSDGRWRLRREVEAQIRAELKRESQSANFWQRLKIELRVRRQTRAQMKQLMSSYSLWASLR